MSKEEGKRGDLEFGTVPRMLARSAERFGERSAIEDGATRFTYRELRERVLEVGASLLARGIQRGDRVAVWAPNVWEWAVAALGALHVGAVLVPMNTRYRGHEAAFILGKSRARLLFTVTGFLGTDYVSLLRESGEALPSLEGIVILRGEAPEGTVAFDAFLAEGKAVSREAVEARGLEVQPDDPVDILFTSGTTGQPKGVVCTHAQNLRAVGAWAEVTGLREGDRYLVVLPFFHSFGYKCGLIVCLMMGATILPEAVFDAGVVLERIPRDRITVMPGPPALYQSILLRPDYEDYDLSTLRLAVTGAASIPVQLVVDMREKLGFETVITGYGLTESTGVVTMCRYDDDPETIAQTSGRAIPGVEVEIHDPEGNALPPNTPGEIVVRGFNVMKGYFEAPEATAEAIDAEGWLHTGDVGTLDERGYIRITDRIKDMFIVGGFNAYPAEIENTLLLHPQVAEAAVIGIPDERLGEVGMAFLVPRAGETIDEASILEFCKARLANYKVPRRVKVVDALPRNATGKVTKFVLREMV
ncbi:MAG: fatty acid--CoA ligase family protein [Myxococcales bacterium]|nr:fatty acid--CoA ligase family protein [Myxococcales bacterium]